MRSIDSPTDFPLMFKKIYSISNVDKESIFIPLVIIQDFKVDLIASAIEFSLSLSNARIKIFSSLTRKGLYFIFFLEDGIVSS